jgi:hypothetical protein
MYVHRNSMYSYYIVIKKFKKIVLRKNKYHESCSINDINFDFYYFLHQYLMQKVIISLKYIVVNF